MTDGGFLFDELQFPQEIIEEEILDCGSGGTGAVYSHLITEDQEQEVLQN